MSSTYVIYSSSFRHPLLLFQISREEEWRTPPMRCQEREPMLQTAAAKSHALPTLSTAHVPCLCTAHIPACPLCARSPKCHALACFVHRQCPCATPWPIFQQTISLRLLNRSGGWLPRHTPAANRMTKWCRLHRRQLCMRMAWWSSGDGEVVLSSIYIFRSYSFRHPLLFFSFSRSPE